MPRGDQTGPRGSGPMTGRGMGFCAGYDAPGYMNPGLNPRSRGNYGSGRGMGRGNRWGFYATGQPGWARERNWEDMPLSPEYNAGYPQRMDDREEIHYLKKQAKQLGQMLEKINSRLDELDNKKNE